MTKGQLLKLYAVGERNFQRVDLSGSWFGGTDLSGADLSFANLEGAGFDKATLVGVNFSNARLGAPGGSQWYRWGVAAFLSVLAAIGAVLTGKLLSLLINGSADPSYDQSSGIFATIICAICTLVFIFRGFKGIAGAVAIALLMLMNTVIALFSDSRAIKIARHFNASAPSDFVNSIGGIAASIAICVMAVVTVAGLYTISSFTNRYIAFLASMITIATEFPKISAIDSISISITFAVVLIAIYVSIRATAGDERFSLARDLGLQLACLGSTSFAGANLTGANFGRTSLQGTDFSGAQLDHTRFREAKRITLARFGLQPMGQTEVQDIAAGRCKRSRSYDRFNLSGLNLQDSDLTGMSFHSTNFQRADLRNTRLNQCNLQEASLRDANLRGADLSGAHLDSADLRGACLAETNTQRASWKGAQIDVVTYSSSSWNPDVLAELHRAGVKLVALDVFPQDAQAAVLGQDGLTLYFCTRLTPIDRFLIDGIIFGVLGKETNCRIVEFRERGDMASLHLAAGNREDLERVADALYRKIWEVQQGRVEEVALVSTNNLLGPHACAALSELHSRLEKVELQVEQQQAWRWNFIQDRVEFARTIRLFLSYAPNDEQHRQDFEGHLAILKRQRIIQTWHSGMLQVGLNIVEEQQRHLDEADVIVLLVSSDYVRSDGLYDQYQKALHRQTIGESRVLPVLVRPVALAGSPLEQLRCLPSDGRPITRWDDKDDAWTNVVNSIRMIVLGMIGKQDKLALLKETPIDM